MAKKIVLTKGTYNLSNIDLDDENAEQILEREFKYIIDIYKELEFAEKERIMMGFYKDGLFNEETALKLSRMKWEDLPLEIKLLIVALEFM